MMKILFLSLFFSLQLFSQSLETKTIVLPADLAGVKLDAPEDKSVSINIRYVMIDKFVQIKKTDSKSLNSFFENLMWIYINKKKAELIKQFEKKSQSEVQKLKNFKVQFEVMSLIRKPFLKSIQAFRDGFLFRWSDESFLDERKIFVRKIGSQYKISKLNISKEDKFFWNSNLFFKYKKFEKKKPKLISSFSSIKDTDVKNLSVGVDEGFNHLNIFKSTEEFVNLIALDNYNSASYPFKDNNKALGKIKLSFSGKNFKKKGKYKLHLLQSTYPLGKLSSEHFKGSLSFELVKK